MFINIVLIINAIPVFGWIANLAVILFRLDGILMVIRDWLLSFKKAK